MKKFIIVAVLAMFYFADSSSPVFADGNTYKRLVCSPDNYDDEEHKKCAYKFKLKKLQTKEFRGYCSEVTAEGKTKTVKPYGQNCKKNNSANSCTETSDPAFGRLTQYMSCSCTNWDVTTSHNVRVIIDCSE